MIWQGMVTHNNKWSACGTFQKFLELIKSGRNVWKNGTYRYELTGASELNLASTIYQKIVWN